MNDFIIVTPTDREPFEQNLYRYEKLVEEIEGGYSMCIYEYTNDLYCRNIIQEMLDNGYAPKKEALARLAMFDTRLKELLLPTTVSIHGNYPSQYFWFYGVPRNAPEVQEDARAIGVLK